MSAANETTVNRTSDTELVVTRTFDAPARIVYAAWSNAEHFKRWWAPRSMGVPIRECEIDMRTGGKYRLQFGKDAENTFQFFGKYLEVVPERKIVWTNDEEEDGQITTVTFEESGGKTNLTIRDVYPSKAALDEAMVSGATGGFEEQFGQLDEFLAETAGA